MKERQQNCETRIDQHLSGRIADLTRLWDASRPGNESDDSDITLFDYGLSFDYVRPGTFNAQPEGYFRYQLSWGGASDEFRFFVNPDLSCHRVEYWFLDWFDSAQRHITGEPQRPMMQLWDWFRETGTARAALNE
jgi:hypothetical protein